MSIQTDDRYVRLKPEYTEGLCWSNCPSDLDLSGAFGADKPTLSNDYNIEGLRPNLKDKGGSGT
jgi:hypothetical protein